MTTSPTTYTVEQLAGGSYDVLLGGTVIASLVRNARPGGPGANWYAALLDVLPPFERPAPFTSQRHVFESRPKALEWLGVTPFSDASGAEGTSSRRA